MRLRRRFTITAMIIALLPLACATISEQSEQVAKPATVRLEPKAPSPVAAEVSSRADHLQGLPPAEYGNRVDWVQAQETGKIEPKGDISAEVEPRGSRYGYRHTGKGEHGSRASSPIRYTPNGLVVKAATPDSLKWSRVPVRCRKRKW